MTAWNKYYYKGKMDVKSSTTRGKIKPFYNARNHLCIICGKEIEKGKMCKSCLEFIHNK